MKQLKFIAVAIMALVAGGCCKDEPEPEQKFTLATHSLELLQDGKTIEVAFNNAPGPVTVTLPEAERDYLSVSITAKELQLTAQKPYYGSDKVISLQVKSGQTILTLRVNIKGILAPSINSDQFGIYYADHTPVLKANYSLKRESLVWISSYQGGNPYQEFIKIVPLERSKVRINAEIAITLTTKNVNGYANGSHSLQAIVSKVSNDRVYLQLDGTPPAAKIIIAPLK